jgi:hypothetical protein
VVFIACNCEQVDVRRVVYRIVERGLEGASFGRFTHKVLPVQRAFKAEFFALKEALA